MTYTAKKPPLARTSDQLRAQIPGWGVDLDPADRPAFPQELPAPADTGAHWDFPDRQSTDIFRERSVEHEFLPPVFGTSVPLRGLSGMIRRYAYARFSEARAAHWLLLLAADRVDVGESHLRSVPGLRPDNPLVGTGLGSEWTHRGLASRVGRSRADVKHQWMDPIVVAAPGVLLVAAGVRTIRAARRRRASR